MNIAFNDETFRDDFTFRNSSQSIRRFPFPFHEDSYMYAVNMEPHVPLARDSAYGTLIDVDEHYVAEMRDRALVLKEDPLRYQALPHMMTAQWDTLELLMEQQATGFDPKDPALKDPQGYADRRSLRGIVGEMLDRINPAQIELIEVYRGVSDLPGEFHDDNCAAIVIWTK